MFHSLFPKVAGFQVSVVSPPYKGGGENETMKPKMKPNCNPMENTAKFHVSK